VIKAQIKKLINIFPLTCAVIFVVIQFQNLSEVLTNIDNIQENVDLYMSKDFSVVIDLKEKDKILHDYLKYHNIINMNLKNRLEEIFNHTFTVLFFLGLYVLCLFLPNKEK
jgi:uncharacterized protein YebE (UPF0316 family)